MERISLSVRTSKKEGTVQLRFRLRDGRNIDLYHKSEITADIKDLAKFNPDGTLKPRVSIYNVELHDKISNEISAMANAYKKLKEQGRVINGDSFEQMISSELHPALHGKRLPGKGKHPGKSSSTGNFLDQFDNFITSNHQDGIIGTGRLKHYLVTQKELERFLTIKNAINISVNEFNDDVLMEYRLFLINEYKYVDRWHELYAGMRKSNIPSKERNPNTVAQKLNQLQAFFSYIENKDIISKSPFRKLGKIRKSVALHEEYDEPVYLTNEEFLKVMSTVVPENLQETQDAFLVQCALGCRISDFKKMTIHNLKVSDDGIPYIRYLPIKTKSKSKEDVQTPLMKFALEIILKNRFSFRILSYFNGERGYNDKIKRLLEYCGIDRECKVFDHEKNDNIYVPLYSLASSKICRKTHVDMLNKVQIDIYAAQLHKNGSHAVERYTSFGLKDRFVLMCAAFHQPLYKVSDNFEIIME